MRHQRLAETSIFTLGLRSAARLVQPTMKFKATLYGAEMLLRTGGPFLCLLQPIINLQSLGMCQALDKNAKTCIMKLSERKLEFILTSDVADGMQVWSGLNSSTVFKDMIIESLQRNEIYFELGLDHLLKALKSAAVNGAEVVIKLTKKNNVPYLSFTVVVQVRALVVTYS